MQAIALERSRATSGIAVLLLLTAVLLAPLCFLGYGTWLNVYMMLSAGKSTWIEHVPQTSRPPGYWAYEFVMFLTSQVGGYVLTNAVNLAVSLADIYLVYALAIRWHAKSPVLCAAIVAANPIFVIEATSSQDFNLSLAFLLLGVLALDRRQFRLAGLWCGAACLFRLSAIIPVGGIYAAFLVVHWRERRAMLHLVGSGAIAVTLFVAGCIPSILVLGPTFYKGNLGPAEMWGATAWIGRFVYKVFYFFGGPIVMVGAVVFAAAAVLGRRRGAPSAPADLGDGGRGIGLNRETVLIWICLAGGLALFAKYPIRQSYLIVALPFFALAVDQLSRPLGRAFSVTVILALLSQNLVLINLAKPDIQGRSTSGSLSLSIEPGYLLTDIRERQRFMGCDTLDCFKRIAGE